MIESNIRGQSAVLATIRVLVAFEAVTFLVAAALHLGLLLPFGLAEQPMLPAGIVEGFAGLFCAGSIYAIVTHQPWAWYAAMVANSFALSGVLLGMWSLASGYGPNTDLNGVYHLMMLVVLVACIVLLLTPSGKARLDDMSKR